MDTILYYPILLPLIFGAVSLLFPRKVRGVREVLAVLASLTMIGLSAYIFTLPDIANHSSCCLLYTSPSPRD